MRRAVPIASCLLALGLSAPGCEDPPQGDRLPEGGFTTGEAALGTSTGTPDGSSTAAESSTGDATQSTGTAVDSSGGDSSTGEIEDVSYAESVQPIWNERCFGAGCHDSSPVGAAVVNLSPDGATDPYDNLTTRAHGNSGMPYVTVGEPEASYLYRKLEGSHTTGDLRGLGQGSLMPLTGGPLSDEDLTTVRHWILTGAMP